MATNSPDLCPTCGASLPANAPRGLCPRCLFRGGLDSSASGPADPVGIDATIDLGDSPSGLETIAATVGPVLRLSLGDTVPGDEMLVPRPGSTEIPSTADRPARLHLLGEIGRGGMGVILKGHDEALGRDLAVKVLLDTHRAKPDLVRRFVEEAQIGGQLQHPGIVPIYELGAFADRRPYFAMKLVEGETLATILAGRPTPTDGLPRLLGIFEQVCQTMAYAHVRGVIHRDLKPSNIMVGGFGEVQVMDWGLAKVLRKGAAEADRPDGGLDPVETVVLNARGDSDSDLSRAGSVMGTPAYMAPEQARGELRNIDERADVFALGSILAEVLTGSPAYTGRTSVEVHGRAARGEISEAMMRLDACEAEAELIGLARDCLALEPGDRPRDASAVTGRVTAYLTGVQERLRAAELARAAEAARAEEARRTAEAERRSRRLTAALAASIVGLIALGGGGYGWSLRQHADRRSRTAAAVDEALTEAARLRGEARANPGAASEWAEALAAARRAEGLLRQGEADSTLRRRVAGRVEALVLERDAAEADRRLLAVLEAIRGGFADGNPDRTDADYAAAFRTAGLDLDAVAPVEAGTWIARRGRPIELAAYLDDWSLVRREAGRDEADWLRLVAAARAADLDPWRDALRAKVESRDEAATAAFRALADDAEALDAQPAASLVLLAMQLRDFAADRERAEAVLRRAWRRYPGDFWVNFRMAKAPGRDSGWLQEIYPRPQEALRYLTAAVAIRPGSAMAHSSLGIALQVSGDPPGAIAACREAIRLNPRLAGAHNDLGIVLRMSGDLTGAIAASREAIRLKPDDSGFHTMLAIALRYSGNRSGALEASREAIRLKPNEAGAHGNLGFDLSLSGDRPGAIAAYREAIRLKPEGVTAHLNLGLELQKSGDLPGAIAAFRDVVRLRPDVAGNHFKLGVALELSGDRPGAIEAYREAIRLKPDHAEALSKLGDALRATGDPEGTVATYREAVRLKPDNAAAHANLGAALLQMDDLPGAIAAYREAVRLEPAKIKAHNDLANALKVSGDLPGAIEAYREMIRRNPENAMAHNKLAYRLLERGEPESALAEVQEALRRNPNMPIALATLGEIHLNEGRFAESLADLERARARFAETRAPDGVRRCDGLISSASWLVDREADLKALAADRGRDRAELTCLDLATLAQDASQPDLATRLFSVAFLATPDLAAAHLSGRILAVAGRAHDDPPSDDAAGPARRRKALDGLNTELAAWIVALDPSVRDYRLIVSRVLRRWQGDPDLAGVRDTDALEALPEPERAAWRAFWSEVEALLAKVAGGKP